MYSCINVFVGANDQPSAKLCTGMCEMRSVEVSAPSEEVRKWLDAPLQSLLSTTGPQRLVF